MVMGGYGVDTGGFGWLLVIVNNPKIIGPKNEQNNRKIIVLVKENNRDDGDVKLFQKVIGIASLLKNEPSTSHRSEN